MSGHSENDPLERTATIAPSATPHAPGPSPVARSDRPARIGRFVVEDEVGRGGMGVVYRASDPLLGRAVAVKLLARRDGGTEGRARLLREAQAIAQLQHPNVVGVHDVGEHEGQVYLAMEFLAGTSLRHWQAGRTPRTVLEAYLAAGRGLAAAHAAGLVHRDFKADNVSVDAAGHVKLLDFGLARATDGEAEPAAPVAAGLPTLSGPLVLESALTVAGTIMGTPAYMAPEQLAGQAAGPAADQFAFCVSLWEALTGARPFAGKDLPSLKAAIALGPPTPPGRGWTRAVLAVAARGLSAEPRLRFESLAECLEAIAAAAGEHAFDLEVGRRQRRWLLATITLCGLVVEAGFLTGFVPYPRTAEGLIPLAIATLGVMMALTFALRRSLLATDINRRIGLLALGMAGLTLVNRLLGVEFGADVAHILATDLLCVGALCVGVSTRRAPWFAVAAGIQLTAALACALLPAWAPHVFTAESLLTAALMAWYWER
jgi:serine/threonine-protein kinase